MFTLSYHPSISTEETLDQIFGILCTCQHEFVPPLCQRTSPSQSALTPDKATQNRPTAYFDEMKTQHFILAHDEQGILAGFLSFKPRYTCEQLAPYGENIYMTTACILPEYRGKGIVNRLYEMTESGLPEQVRTPYVTTRTWSTHGLQLHAFEKRGYTIAALLKDHRGPGIDTVYFVKKM